MSGQGERSDYRRAIDDFAEWYPQSSVARDSLREFVQMDHQILADYRGNDDEAWDGDAANKNDVTLAEFIRAYRRDFVRLVGRMSEYVLAPSDAAQELDAFSDDVWRRYLKRYGRESKIDAFDRWEREYDGDDAEKWLGDEEIEANAAEKAALLARRLARTPQYVVYVVTLVMLLVFARGFLVPSGSMIPTLNEGDRILSLARYFPDGHTYQPGDIVCFHEPVNGEVYVKRVVACGGDVVRISGETLYVNDEPSPWQGGGTGRYPGVWELADDEYFMMGDNRANSQDSRVIGPIKANRVISKVDFVYWPPSHAQYFAGSGLLGL